MHLHPSHLGRRVGDVLAIRSFSLLQRYLERTDQAILEGHLVEVGDDGTTAEERRFLELALASLLGARALVPMPRQEEPRHPDRVRARGAVAQPVRAEDS